MKTAKDINCTPLKYVRAFLNERLAVLGAPDCGFCRGFERRVVEAETNDRNIFSRNKIINTIEVLEHLMGTRHFVDEYRQWLVSDEERLAQATKLVDEILFPDD